MERILIGRLPNMHGAEVQIAGFVSNVRVLKRMVFVVVQDRTGSVQVSIERDRSDIADVAKQLTPGSAVIVHGSVNVTHAVKSGGIEILPFAISNVGPAEPEMPIQDESAAELQLDWRFLALRKPRNWLLFEVQTTILQAMRGFWNDSRFIELESPKLMHSASESGAETFSVDYFSLGKAYLAQSPQFYKQMAMAAGFDRVFEIGPVFRAEPSMTIRHATEFISVDAEISWIESHEDVMRMEEAWLHSVITTVRDKHGDDIAREFGVDVIVPPTTFPRITIAEAQNILKNCGHVIPPTTKTGDLDPEGERVLARLMLERNASEFYFLTDYPVELRPFYHMRYDAQPRLTKSFDLLWKGTEITTGAQREHRYSRLAQQAETAGLKDSVSYYLDFFRFGCPPHGGFGFGLARFIMLMLNLPSIREAAFLHRSPNRLAP